MVPDGARTQKLSRWTLLRVYLRSFFSQGSFSVAHRQNIGFAFCMEPAGRKIWPDADDLRKFRLRHLEYYNGNPFMVTLVLGAVIRMEERLRDNDGVTGEDVNRFKTAVGQAVGSVGDRLFWRTLRPFSLVAGLLGAMAFGVWGAVAFLAAFNTPVFLLKWYWLVRGYTLGPRVVIEIRNPVIDPAVNAMDVAGSVLMPLIAAGMLGGAWYLSGRMAAGAAGMFLTGCVLSAAHLRPMTIFGMSVVLAVLFGFAVM